MGSMKLDEKLEAISAFNESAQFMVSTEAGGEGINLHESCHVMVNYDLPWKSVSVGPTYWPIIPLWSKEKSRCL